MRKRGLSMARGQTVRDLAQRLGFLLDEPDGPRLGRMVRTCAGAAEFAEQHLDLASGRDPVGEERS